MLYVFIFSISLQTLIAAELKKETVQAWDRYIKWADDKVHRDLDTPNVFFTMNSYSSGEKSALQKQLESGEIVVRKMTDVVPKGIKFSIPDGEIHHWWGAILLRNITIQQLFKFLQDYDHHAGKFSDVERSRLISKNDDFFRVYFRFRRSKAFVTVVYNTEQDCRYTTYNSNRAFSQSIATKIAEVENAGTASEREKTPGNDSGYLWKLVSWWRYEQKGNDVIVQLESASLSRDIPFMIKVIPGIIGYIRSTPRESLESVLTSIKKHVK